MAIKLIDMLIVSLKDLYSCRIEFIIGLTYKGQFQYLTGLKGSQEVTRGHLTVTVYNAISFTKMKIIVLSDLQGTTLLL